MEPVLHAWHLRTELGIAAPRLTLNQAPQWGPGQHPGEVVMDLCAVSSCDGLAMWTVNGLDAYPEAGLRICQIYMGLKEPLLALSTCCLGTSLGSGGVSPEGRSFSGGT